MIRSLGNSQLEEEIKLLVMDTQLINCKGGFKIQAIHPNCSLNSEPIQRDGERHSLYGWESWLGLGWVTYASPTVGRLALLALRGFSRTITGRSAPWALSWQMHTLRVERRIFCLPEWSVVAIAILPRTRTGVEDHLLIKKKIASLVQGNGVSLWSIFQLSLIRRRGGRTVS